MHMLRAKREIIILRDFSRRKEVIQAGHSCSNMAAIEDFVYLDDGIELVSKKIFTHFRQLFLQLLHLCIVERIYRYVCLCMNLFCSKTHAIVEVNLVILMIICQKPFRVEEALEVGSINSSAKDTSLDKCVKYFIYVYMCFYHEGAPICHLQNPENCKCGRFSQGII